MFYKKKANPSLLKQYFGFYWFYFAFKQFIWLIVNHINIFNQLTALKMDSHLFLILLSASVFFFPSPTYNAFFFFFHNGQTERRDKRKMKEKMGYYYLFHFFSPAEAESPLIMQYFCRIFIPLRPYHNPISSCPGTSSFSLNVSHMVLLLGAPYSPAHSLTPNGFQHWSPN